MRRNISLYIDGKMVDLDDQSFILFNYSYEDLDNPTIVKNSFSQQISLKGTATNNAVFNDAFRLDRISTDGFNPRLKSPFAIYDDMGSLLESGYVKLDSVTRTRNASEYKVTLYGGLGSFLYGLTYDANGDKMSLASLDFLGTQNPDTEFNYTIGINLVAQAWERLAGTSPITLFDVINFAPAYNGLPSDFSADKAVFDGEVVNRPGNTYMANLSRSYTEMEMHDLRTYLQRPVIRFKSILAAISRYATSQGYTFTIDQNWADDVNPYYEDLWMTLPILKGKRSGDTFTKKDIMDGTDTPADYLLSYCKMFGLKLICDDKNVSLLSRDSFFLDNVRDIEKRISLKDGFNITPIIFSSKWYEMKSEDSCEFAKYYNDVYGRDYGLQRINTGYAFDSETNDITDTIIFKGSVQSKEKSSSFRTTSKETSGDAIAFPSSFLDGGTYNYSTPDGETAEGNLINGKLFYTWWDTTNNGYDKVDLPQIHESDNKALTGSNILLFFTGMQACNDLRLTDDIPAQMVDSPCWNVSSVNMREMTTIPHFSRFITEDGEITKSLDFGDSQEINVPGLTYGDDAGIYARRWQAYIRDRFNENTKKVTIKVDLSGIQVGQDLLRRFYWFGNSIWMLNKISNYSLTTYDDVECEFIQVQDKDNYINGQI